MKIINDSELLHIIHNTLNEIDERLIDHGFRVAYLLREMMIQDGSYSEEEIRDMSMVAILHDIGAYKTDEIDAMLGFESRHIWKHAVYGYLFLKYLSPLKQLSSVVLYHHVPFQDYGLYDIPYPKLTQMLHLVDHCDLYLIRKEKFPDDFHDRLSTEEYDPELTALLKKTVQKSNVVEVITHEHHENRLMEELHFNEQEILQYISLISYSIDFQSKHMVAHTITTTSISKTLGTLLNLSDIQIQKLMYGALLHDIGKVATPVSILEKPGRLTASEMKIMREHVTHSIHILKGTMDNEIVQIAVRHHEKLNGKGYPYGLSEKDLTLEQRILAVADIFSALSGKRSYKEAFDKQQMMHILYQMADEGAIDPTIVDICHEHFHTIMENIETDCIPLLSTYHHIEYEYEHILQVIGKKG